MSGRYISVRATVPSRRRAGIQFGPEPVILDLEELVENQITRIAEDPDLKVEFATDEEVAAFTAPPVLDRADTALALALNALPEHGFEIRYQGQSIAIELTGDPFADFAKFFDEIALFSEATGLAEAARLSQPPEDDGDETGDQGNAADTEKAAAETGEQGNAADTEKAAAETGDQAKVQGTENAAAETGKKPAGTARKAKGGGTED